MAMTNYPYPANFLEPMPAWPINEAVKAWVDIPTKAELEEESSVWVKIINASIGFFEGVSDTVLSYVKPSPADIEKKQVADGLSDREILLLKAL